MKKILRKILGSRLIGYDYRIVHIYVDKDDRLTLIPTGESKKWHMITDLNLSIELVPPYSDKKLEEKLNEALKMCFSYVPDDISYKNAVEKSNASKTYNRKVKGKRLISLFWNKADGYMIEPYKKAKDKGFSIIEEKVIRLGNKTSEGIFADAIKEAMKIAEPY